MGGEPAGRGAAGVTPATRRAVGVSVGGGAGGRWGRALQRGGGPGAPRPLGAWWRSAWGRRHEGSGASVVRPRSGGSYDPSGVEQLGRGRGGGVTDYSAPVGAEPAGEDMGDQRPGDRKSVV